MSSSVSSSNLQKAADALLAKNELLFCYSEKGCSGEHYWFSYGRGAHYVSEEFIKEFPEQLKKMGIEASLQKVEDVATKVLSDYKVTLSKASESSLPKEATWTPSLSSAEKEASKHMWRGV